MKNETNYLPVGGKGGREVKKKYFGGIWGENDFRDRSPYGKRNEEGGTFSYDWGTRSVSFQRDPGEGSPFIRLTPDVGRSGVTTSVTPGGEA